MLGKSSFVDMISSRADMLPQILCLTDNRGIIMSMNRRGQDIFSGSGDCVTGRPVTDLFAHSEKERFAAEYARAVDGTGSSPSLYALVDRNGCRFQVLPIFTPAREGFWLNFIETDAASTVHNINSQEDLFAFMDIFPQPFFEIDESGTLTYVNRHGLREFGFTREDFEKGLNVYDLINLPGKKQAHQIDGKILTCHEYTILRKDGSTVPVLVHLVTVTRSGKASGKRGVVTDISEVRAAQDELERMNQTLNLVTSLTRHELMNILTPLAGWIDLAASVTTEPDVDQYLKKASKSAGMLRKHLEFSREVQQVGAAAPTWQRLNSTVASARSYLENGAQDLTVRTEVGDVRVLADTLFDRVFYILLENSLRHGEGVTVVRVRVEGTRVLYEDNGCGVPDREKKRIFDLGHGKNTGFGLYLARRILAVTGIKIREEGKPGTGAKFVLSIPHGQIKIF